jgi:hypothetical protein
MSISTVRVKSSHPDHEQGFYVINESDFDKAKHELWVDKAAEAKRAEVIEANRAEALKVAQAIKAAQVNSAKPVLGISSGPGGSGRDDRNR